MNKLDIKLVKTCCACPEQYDAIYNGEEIAYLRLRHGYFYVECPFDSNNIVYESNPKGDGEFYRDEREAELDNALNAIVEFYNNRGEN